MRYKKFAVLSVAFFALLFSATFTLTAQAQTFEERIPTFGLYSEDSEVIKSGIVNFDLTDKELLSKGIGIKYSEYQVAATNCVVEFAIPFLARACELPDISLAVNEQKLEGTVWYGERAVGVVDFDDENIYSPVLDDCITGTLYTVIPDDDTITISLSFNKRSCYVYETFTDYSSSHSADGNNTWTIRNALATSDYEFFVVGDASDYSFSSSSQYQTKTLTCKEFVDGKYAEMIEYYEMCGVPVEFFYSMFNRALQSNSDMEYRELFANSFSASRLNAYKFSVSIDADAVISYELPISVQRNYAFKPLIYLVEQKQVKNCPIEYTIELNNEIPYIIESSVDIERNGIRYAAKTEEDFYFVFSSSKKPANTTTNTDNGNKTVLIVCIAVGGVVFIGVVALISYLIYRRRV